MDWKNSLKSHLIHFVCEGLKITRNCSKHVKLAHVVQNCLSSMSVCMCVVGEEKMRDTHTH